MARITGIISAQTIAFKALKWPQDVDGWQRTNPIELEIL
jgi:hypothetical protein